MDTLNHPTGDPTPWNYPSRRLSSRRGRSGRGVLLALLAAALLAGVLAAPAAAQQDADASGDAVVRITARRLDDNRVEFALQQRQPDGAWSQRLLPRARYFPAAAQPGRWLNSTPIALTGTTPAAGSGAARTYTAIAAGVSHT